MPSKGKKVAARQNNLRRRRGGGEPTGSRGEPGRCTTRVVRCGSNGVGPRVRYCNRHDPTANRFPNRYCHGPARFRAPGPPF